MRALQKSSLVLTAGTIAAALAVILVLGIGVAIGAGSAKSSTVSSSVPSYCVRPPGGFLIVVSKYGYNESILEGAGPSKPWPIVSVSLGATVKIAVCNTDSVSHGFQISQYEDQVVNIIEPGHTLNVSFAADKEGTYGIYCAIPCDIHVFLQYGQLRVLASASASSSSS